MSGDQTESEPAARGAADNHDNRADRQLAPVQRPVCGRLAVPGSKSYSNRALIIAALTNGESQIHGLLHSDDSYWCQTALARLGVRVQQSADTTTVHGVGSVWPVRETSLYVGSSGTLARFLPAALAVSQSGRWRMDASAQMRQRPMNPLLPALRQLGARISCPRRDGYLPIDIEAGGLSGGDISMAGDVSSQFFSGLLLAAPYMQQGLNLQVTSPIVQHAYVQMTIDLMRQFGAHVEVRADETAFRVWPSPYRATLVQVEADASTACYFWALAAVTGGDVTVTNLSPSTRQPDIQFLSILQRMGCTVDTQSAGITVQGPPRQAGKRALRGGFTVSMAEMSDQTPTLAVVAAFADAAVTITDVAHIRRHESDRLQAICASLARAGVDVTEHADGLTVTPAAPAQYATFPTYDDHRMAMSLAVLAAAGSGGVLRNAGCVAKTCPPFFDLLAALGVPSETVVQLPSDAER